MPRCITSTSPDERSVSRDLARRPSPVTVLPSRRATKSFGSGHRRSPRRNSTLEKRAPSIAGSRPRRTVSTSGNSGIRLRCVTLLYDLGRRLAESDPVTERIDHGKFGHVPILLLQARFVMAIVLVV